jgi:hypothetical protein
LAPSAEAFDAVREEAAAQGISAIYVLVDEAQALFSNSGDPHRLGEVIKARLESSWGSAVEKKAAVLLGLVGQAHLFGQLLRRRVPGISRVARLTQKAQPSPAQPPRRLGMFLAELGQLDKHQLQSFDDSLGISSSSNGSTAFKKLRRISGCSPKMRLKTRSLRGSRKRFRLVEGGWLIVEREFGPQLPQKPLSGIQKCEA